MPDHEAATRGPRRRPASLDAGEQQQRGVQSNVLLLLAGIEEIPGVAEVRGRGMMVGIDLGEHDPAHRIGHRVTLEARKRGAIIRPLGDTVVLMPPLSISKGDLRRLVEITGEAIEAALAPSVRELRPAGVPRIPQAA